MKNVQKQKLITICPIVLPCGHMYSHASPIRHPDPLCGGQLTSPPGQIGGSLQRSGGFSVKYHMNINHMNINLKKILFF